MTPDRSHFRLAALTWSRWFWCLPRRVLMCFVSAYRLLLSPWLGAACRFEPTCSVYALQALRDRGAVAGTCLTLRRLARCNPWCEGGHDPVRSAQHPCAAALFSSLIGRSTPSSSSEKTSS